MSEDTSNPAQKDGGEEDQQVAAGEQQVAAGEQQVAAGEQQVAAGEQQVAAGEQAKPPVTKHTVSNYLITAVTLRLAFQSLGVVYGDVGTSILYTFSSTFPNGIVDKEKEILGALSLVLWTLTLSPLIKYVFLVLSFSDNGEGGTFALYSLLCRSIQVGGLVFGAKPRPEDTSVSTYSLPSFRTVTQQSKTRYRQGLQMFMEGSKAIQLILLVVTCFGTCMVIGDGTLTPVISVISAVQGIQVKVPSLHQHAIMGISIAVLVILFALQRYGTDRVGFIFAPVLTLWFVVIAIIGLYNMLKYDPRILRAFYPKYIVDYFISKKKHAFISLGGVVLCITGTEAMFADLGHFTANSIRLAFSLCVYPSLLLAYSGQAAYLMKHPEDVGQAFYNAIPKTAAVYWPMFVLAVLSAIIASQAMISAVFQILKQANSMGCFPRVKVVHTSRRFPGQVYIPEANAFLALACIVITLIFQTTTKLGNAYGICVVSVMFVTTIFTSTIMLLVWEWNFLGVLAYFCVFSILELGYLSAVMVKFTDGGWLPMCFAAVVLYVMLTWFYGSHKQLKSAMSNHLSANWMPGFLENREIVRTPGVGLVYTNLVEGIPYVLAHHVGNSGAMHAVVILVTIKYLPVCNVPEEERFVFKRVGTPDLRMYRCVVRYGYRDEVSKAEFEDLLFENLASFIESHTLHEGEEVEGLAEGSSTSIDVYDLGDDGEHRRNGRNVFTAPTNNELAFVQEMRQSIRGSGVVYLLGRAKLMPREDSNVFKRFMVKSYKVLKFIFRESKVVLEVPKDKACDIGYNVFI